MMDSRRPVTRNKDFLCGVVEGFYGRPWTTEQRKDLFQKMKKWDMDSYLYAPKDDYKHRAYWRELYTVEEADHLSGLVAAAKENGIRFIYAISPGLDIGYSNTKDVAALKRKLEQVSQLGCDAFAVLFDDIDPEMSKADKEIFKSFAHAQVSVTNEIFQHLNPSTFLFCPTQYCATRAIPNVKTSEYLKTLGSKLDLQIDIMWTGPKVISKDLSIESIEEVAEVMRRPPVIWDNLHANDYDQKRIFLGPYSGRSPQLIPRLRGVLTNPNCEYGSNFVAIHTLAQWSRCSVDAKKKIEEAMNPDAKLETENDGEVGQVPENMDPHIYHPTVALKAALQEWLQEFKRVKTAWGPIVKPQIATVPAPLVPSVNTCIAAVSSTACNLPVSDVILAPRIINNALTNASTTELPALDNAFPSILAAPPTVMNSLMADNKVVCADSVQTVPMNSSGSLSPGLTVVPVSISSTKVCDAENSQTIITSGLEPMDTATPPNPSPPDQMVVIAESRATEDVLMVDREERSDMSSPDESTESNTASISGMNVDSDIKVNSNPATLSNTPSSTMQVENQESLETETSDDLTVSDLQLLCDLFYLPFEHGIQGIQILNEFQWLKINCSLVAGISLKDREKPEISEWYERATKFEELADNLNRLLTKLNLVNNRELLYELYPYMWDIRGVVSLLNSYIKWLAMERTPANVTTFVHGSYTWFSKGWREAFMSGDQEPWVIRGGLTAELQRLIPVDRGTDLYVYKTPAIPSSQTYTIRPFRPDDMDAVYKIVLATYKDGINAAEEFIHCPKLPGDLKVGGYLSLNADLSFVVEDDNELVVGIAVAVLNGKEFRRKLNASWIPMLKDKHPISLLENSVDVNRVNSILHSGMTEVPDQILSNHQAELRFAIMSPLVDPSVPKRLMTCILAALRANGVFGCYVEVPSVDKHTTEFCKKLGFVDLCPDFMVRNF
ncbi:unnamed protein product [Allacma fusca]|uniref:protein O-GlcNAcase n=1 Tax=Allacma fusca TaxID=39272 RepID=A0A8J2K1T9_9HEXA|nr:unnamed protein product [Allacma fusca]